MNTQRVPVYELARVARSKRELYFLLVVEADLFLPKMETIDYWFLKQVLSGEKKALKNTEVKVKDLPKLKNIKVEDLYQYSLSVDTIRPFMPDYRNGKLPERRFLISVLNTLDKDFIDLLYKKCVEEKVSRLKAKDTEIVEIDKEIYKAIASSSQITTHNTAREVFLLKKRVREEQQKTKLKKEKIMELQNKKS